MVKVDVLCIKLSPIGFVKTEFVSEELRNRPIDEQEVDIEIPDKYADGQEILMVFLIFSLSFLFTPTLNNPL